MNIVFIAPRFHTNQRKIIEYLSQNNSIVFFATRSSKSEDHSFLSPTLLSYSWASNLIKNILRPKNELFDDVYGIPSFQSIKKYLKINPDLVIIRNPNSVLGIIIAVLSRLRSTKIIFYTQTRVHQNITIYKRLTYKALLKIFNAHWMSPCLGDKSVNKIDVKFDYVPFCVDPHNFHKEWFKNNKINIVSVGKFQARKNHHLLIQALDAISKETAIELTIIGEVSNKRHEEHYKLISKMASEVDFAVKLITNATTKEVNVTYKNSDLFILASDNERASISNLEAMSYGLPTILSTSNGTNCYTNHGKNGYIFQTNDLQDLTEKIKLLACDRGKIIQFGAESLKTIKENHNKDRIYKEYFNTLGLDC